MFVMTGQSLKLRADHPDAWTLIEDVSRYVSLRPFFCGMMDAAHKSIGHAQPKSLSYFGGAWTRPFDLLFSRESCILVLCNGLGVVETWEFRLHSAVSMQPGLRSSMQELLRSANPIVSIDSLIRDLKFGVSQRERERREEAASIKWNAPDINELSSKVAAVLFKGSSRELTRRIKMSGTNGLAVAKVSEEQRAELTEIGLARSQWQVRCKKDSRVVCVADDPEELRKSSIKCVCGRSYGNESIEEVLVSGPQASALDQSHWMLRWLTDRAGQIGTPSEMIGWNAVSGSDELDMSISLPGMVAFAELKDRDFGIGDLYPFLVRIEKYGGDAGLICVTGKVEDAVKQFVKEQRKYPPIWIVEDVDKSPSEFDSTLGEMQALAFARLLDRVADSRGVSMPLSAFVRAWYSGVAKSQEASVP